MTMTPRFLAFIPFILQWEGGYDNDSDDPGGETNFGIDKRSHPNEDIRHLTQARAIQIYWESYWLPTQSEALAFPVGEIMMNISVNAGRGRAIRWLQQAVDVKADGSFGPITLSAAANHNARELGETLLDRTEDHYRDIAHGKLAKFLRGWLNRNNALRVWIK